MSKEGKKKSIFKRWWFWVIVVVVIIGAAASSGGGNDKSASKTDDSKPKTTETTAKPKTEAKKETKKETKKENKSYKIGDTVNVGKMTYKINKKTVADQVGPSALPQKANGKYVVIEVTLKNNGDKAVTVDASFFKLKRGDKTYEADSSASMSANQGEDGNIQNSFFMQDLNPDSEITGKVVFDVAPEVAAATDLQVQVQTGVFGTQTQIINLQ